MQGFREAKSPIPNPNTHINSVYPQPSLLNFELVIQKLQKELTEEDGFQIVRPSVKLSEKSYELRLKNGTTIKCEQEITSEGLSLKTHINLNTTTSKKINSHELAKLATSLTNAECKAGGIKPGPDVKIYIKIEPNNPETQKILALLKKIYRDKGFTVLDNPPDVSPRARSSIR